MREDIITVIGQDSFNKEFVTFEDFPWMGDHTGQMLFLRATILVFQPS